MEVILNQTKYSGYVPITFRNSELKKVELKLLEKSVGTCEGDRYSKFTWKMVFSLTIFFIEFYRINLSDASNIHLQHIKGAQNVKE